MSTLIQKDLDLDFIWCPTCGVRTSHQIVDGKVECKQCRIGNTSLPTTLMLKTLERSQGEEQIMNELGYG